MRTFDTRALLAALTVAPCIGGLAASTAVAEPLEGAIPWTGTGGNDLWTNAANWTDNNLPNTSSEFGYVGSDGISISLDGDVTTSAGLQNEGSGTVINLNGNALDLGGDAITPGPAGNAGLRMYGGSLTFNNGAVRTQSFGFAAGVLEFQAGHLTLDNASLHTDTGGVGNDGILTLNNSTYTLERNPAINGVVNFHGESALIARHMEFGSGDEEEQEPPFNPGTLNFELNGTAYTAGSAAIQTQANIKLQNADGTPTSDFGSGEAYAYFTLEEGFTPEIGQVFHLIHADAVSSSLMTPGQIDGYLANLADGEIITVGDFLMQADYLQTEGYEDEWRIDEGIYEEYDPSLNNLLTLEVVGLVPEPASAALLGLAGIALAARRRRA